MAGVPTVCEVNYDFDEYGYEEVIPLHDETLSLTPRPSDTGGVYRIYDRDCEISLSYLSAEKHAALPRRGASTAQSTYTSFLNERYDNYAGGRYDSIHDTESNALLDTSDIYKYHNEGHFDSRTKSALDNKLLSFPSLSPKPRAKTALPYFPESSVSGYGSMRLRSRGESRLKWVESLETWVEQKSQNPVPYLSFVQNVALADRGAKAEMEVIERDETVHPCGRFLSHMHAKNVSLGPARRIVKTVKPKKPLPQRNEGTGDAHKERPKVRVSYPPWPPKRPKAKKVVVPSASDSHVNKEPPPPPPSPPKSPTPEPPQEAPRDPSLDPDEDMGYKSGDQEEDPDKVIYELGPYVSTERVDDTFVQGMRNVTVKEKPQGGSVWKRSQRNRILPPLEGDNKPDAKTKRTKCRKSRTGMVKKLSVVKSGGDIVVEIPHEAVQQTKKTGDEVLEAQQLSTVKLDDSKKLGLSVKRDPEGEVKKPKKPRPPIVKKTKVVKAKIIPLESPPKSVTPPQFEPRKKVSWIFDDEDFSSEGERAAILKLQETSIDVPDSEEDKDTNNSEKMEEVPEETKTPTPPPRTPTPPPENPSPQLKEEEEEEELYKKRWGPRVKDTSLEEERERQRIAEERRRKAAILFDKLRSGKKHKDGEDDLDGEEGINFDDYDFLAKYCIFNKGNLEMYKKTFDVVDEDADGFLNFEEILMGLKGINRGLSDAEQEYIYRVLEHVGYKVTDGADLKLFSVACALSQRISSLDSWMRNLIGRIDFKMLDMKMFMCKTLWECNVDRETNTIPIDQLCVELRAGGVSLQHEYQVREKLQHLHALDLLDFLSYIPLFIMIHTSVVDNPLDDTRDK